MMLKKTMIYLDEEDHRVLFNLALDESRKQGRRVSMTEMIREAVKAYVHERRMAQSKGKRTSK